MTSWTFTFSWLLGMLYASVLTVGPVYAGEPESKAEPLKSRHIYLHSEVKLDFVPSRAVFFVKDGGGIFDVMDGVLVSPAETGRQPGKLDINQTLPWMAGVAVMEKGQASELEYSLLVTGDTGRSVYVPAKRVKIDDPLIFEGEVDRLRDYVVLMRSSLKGLNDEVASVEFELERLRTDADLIAGLGRIVEVREEIEQKRMAIEGLENDMRNIRRFLSAAHSMPQPRNFVGRESQLTRQLAELADAARKVEKLRYSSSATLNEKEYAETLENEEDGDESVDSLQHELLRLRKRRQDLERGGSEPEGGDSVISGIAERIVKLGLETPAIFFLEMNKPLAGVLSICMDFAQPFVAAVAGRETASSINEIMKDRDGIEKLIQAIEALKKQ